jgi:hypothetical protein
MYSSPAVLPAQNGDRAASENITDDQNVALKMKNCTLTVDNEAGATTTCSTEPVCIRKFDNFNCKWRPSGDDCNNANNCGKQVSTQEAYCLADDITCQTGNQQELFGQPERCSNVSTGVNCTNRKENCPPCGQEYQETK